MGKESTAKELEPRKEPEQEVEEPDLSGYVPKQDYERLMVEAQSAREKAELFDQLLEDPEFQAYLDRPTGERTTKEPPKAPPKDEPDDLVSKLERVIEPIKREIDVMKSAYQSDQEEAWSLEAARQIDAMKADKDNFPFFEDCMNEMAKLLESGRATSMVDAYRIAAFGKAKAEGRSEVLKKTKEKSKIMPSGAKVEKREGARQVFQQGKRSLRDILSDAFDEHGVELVEGEGD